MGICCRNYDLRIIRNMIGISRKMYAYIRIREIHIILKFCEISSIPVESPDLINPAN